MILWPTVSWPVCLGVGHPFGSHDQILIILCLTITFFVLHLGHPLWWEDGPVVCSVNTHRSKSHRTRNHILIPHLRLLQLWGPSPHIYIPKEQGGPVITPGTGYAFHRLLWLTGLQWRYSGRFFITCRIGFYIASVRAAHETLLQTDSILCMCPLLWWCLYWAVAQQQASVALLFRHHAAICMLVQLN
jgi:hypothetical protein